MTNPSSETLDINCLDKLVSSISRRAPLDAVALLDEEPDEVITEVLNRINPTLALRILRQLPQERIASVAIEVQNEVREQWVVNRHYPEESIGRLMSPVSAVLETTMTAACARERIRELVKQTMVTYGFVVDREKRLQGILVMRDLMLAEEDTPLGEIMVPNPFFFIPDRDIGEAMHDVLQRHYLVYPVCDEGGHLIGEVQGTVLFEEQAYELTAQSGRMVGIGKEEHLITPLLTSLKYRHPWLQLNLVTAFLAAFVVGFFEDTIAQIVALAVFLPVLAGQSGNTGSQALAVSLRGIFLDEFHPGMDRRMVIKEAFLGLFNGSLVGVTAGLGMLAYAHMTDAPSPLMLSLVVFLAMTGSCVISGVTGVLVPLTLRRLGADPATASAIFLTTATDVVSMGMFLWMATLLVL